MKSLLIIFFVAEIYLKINAFPEVHLRALNKYQSKVTPHACLVYAPLSSKPSTGSLGAGNIISSRHVLTVASLLKNAAHVTIGYGGTEIQTLLKKTTNLFVVHPEYNQKNSANDIAILYLPFSDAFDFTIPNVAPIRLSTTTTLTGIVGTAAGYGFSETTQGTVNTHLHSAGMQILYSHRCQQHYGIALSTHFCAGSAPRSSLTDPMLANSNICSGDHGAGLYTTSEDNHNYLIGIASLISEVCGTSEVHGFTNVELYVDWIYTMTAINSTINSSL